MDHRNRSEIEVSILKATANTAKNTESAGSKHTEIMHKTAIPNIYLKAYMHLLQQEELIVYDSRRRTFKITEKGIRYLNLSDEVKNLLT